MNKAITLTAALLILLFAECKKDPVIPKENNSSGPIIDTTEIIGKIGGLRYWRGSGFPLPEDNISGEIRDTFAVQPLADTAVTIFQITLHRSDWDAVHRKIRFESISNNVEVWLDYYYEKDSLYYSGIKAGTGTDTVMQIYTWPGRFYNNINPFISGIGGMREWSGTYTTHSLNGHTVQNITDSMEVTDVGDDRTVRLGGKYLIFVEKDPSNKRIVFTEVGGPTSLHYYYEKDSMVYSIFNGDMYHYTHLLLHTQ